MQEPPHATVAAIVQKDGRYLLVQEMADGKKVYNQPAGHLDPGESLVAAVIRETREETAWTVRPTALVGLYTYVAPANGVTYLRVCFAAEPIEHHAGAALDTEIVRAVWRTRTEIEALDRAGELRSPLVLRCIADFERGDRAPLALLHDI